MFTVPAIALQPRTNSALALVAAAGGFVSAVFGTAAIVTWLELLNWRCPRCGKRFVVSAVDNIPTDECKHCGLDLSRPPAA